MDTVKLTIQEINKIFAWKEEHKDEVRKAYQPMKSVRVCIVDNELSMRCFRNGEHITFYGYERKEKIGKFEIEIVPTGYVVKSQTSGLPDGMIPYFVTLYCTLMALFVVGSHSIQRCEQEPEEQEEKPKNTNKPSVKKPKHQKSYCYIIKPEKLNEGSSDHPKREYHKSVESFGVRGHYRHYKSGKVVWVNEYRKGEGKKSNKVYKVGKIEE